VPSQSKIKDFCQLPQGGSQGVGITQLLYKLKFEDFSLDPAAGGQTGRYPSEISKKIRKNMKIFLYNRENL